MATPADAPDGGASPLPVEAEAAIGRVVWVVAHPDDETLTAGGLLAALAARTQLTLVTCTRGERGETIGSDLAHLANDPAELAGYREGELERALVALGVADHVFLDTVDGGPRLVDSGMRWDEHAPFVRALPALDAGPEAFSVAPLDRSVAALVQVLDRVQPDLVIVDEPGGGYGHPDHRRAHEVSTAAVDLARTRPMVAWPVRPASTVAAAQEWLRARTDLPSAGVEGALLTPPAADGPAASIVVPDDAIDVAVDVTPQLPAVVAAMHAHRSQVQAATLLHEVPPEAPATGWFALSNGLLQPILRTAWLRAAPGTDAVALRSAIETTLRPEPGTQPAGRWYRPTMLVFTVLLGIVIAAVGTTFHRVSMPWGLLVALVALAAGGVLARSFLDRAGQLCFGAAAVATVLTMTYVAPGGDVLVTGEPIGIAWILGSIVAGLLVPAVLPRRWFADV